MTKKTSGTDMDLTEEQNERFVKLFARSEPDIRRYIFSLVGNQADTADVLQETSLALWRKFDKYNSDQPFLRWAFRFAYFEVCKFRDRRQRRERFCRETLELLAKEWEDDQEMLRAQRRALQGCLNKLPSEDKELVTLRYGHRFTVPMLCERIGETGKRLYRVLERIRRRLVKCVDVSLAEEGWT